MSSSADPDNWRKATYSAQASDCVEVADNRIVGLLRDTKDPDGGTLAVSRIAFDAFLSAVAS
jgi:hypothetical protein